MQPTPKQDTPNQIRKGHSPPKQAVSPQAAYPDCGCRNAGADGGGANRRRVAIGLDADDGFIEGARDGACAVLGRRGDTLVD
jgi:hypothetical protein